MRRQFFTALALAVLCLLAYGTARAQEYATYVNQEYGYEVKYPRGVFTPLEVAGGESGAVFMAAEKDADIRVNANKDVFDTGLKYEYDNLLGSDVLEKSYNEKEGWFTVKSLKGTSVVYIKKILKDGVYYTLEIEYPDLTREEIDPMVKVISDSFRVLPKSAN